MTGKTSVLLELYKVYVLFLVRGGMRQLDFSLCKFFAVKESFSSVCRFLFVWHCQMTKMEFILCKLQTIADEESIQYASKML